MTKGKIIGTLLYGGAASLLGACGGGGTDTAFIPAPPKTPTPTPTPPPPPPPPTPPPLPAGSIGLTGGPFATYSAQQGTAMAVGKDAVTISYSPATDTYTLSAPGFQPGHLVETTGIGGYTTGSTSWSSFSGTTSHVTAGDSAAVQPGWVELDWTHQAGNVDTLYNSSSPYRSWHLAYTSFGRWSLGDDLHGNFVYGVPTVATDVPVTGTAAYEANISGATDENSPIVGDMKLQFDFGAGTLSGSMSPEIPDWESSYLLGTYTFRDTVYSSGSTSFSGAFAVPGSDAASSFEGAFNGPGAIELMGNWSAPYLSPFTQKWGTMNGVFAGAKTP